MEQTKEVQSDKYIDKPFNVRPLCFWALLVGLTIVMCAAGAKVGVWIVAVWFAVLIGGFGLLCLVKTKDAAVRFFATSRAFFVTAVFLCIAVAAAFSIWSVAWQAALVPTGDGELTGVIEKYRFNETNEGYVYIGSAKFNGKPVSGVVWAWVKDADAEEISKVSVGSRVCVTTSLRAVGAQEDYINARVKYSANVNGDFAVTGRSNNARHVIMRGVNGFLSKYMDDESANVVYAMLFGDKSALGGDTRESFSAVGLAHVLAVSGLHVGLIIGLLSVVLSVCRVPRRWRFPFFIAVLGFYCYLCAFAFPVLRASIMFLVLSANGLLFKRTDFLSLLSLAAIIILLLFPYALFSISFQLSFACMLGLGLFRLPINNWLRKTFKLPKVGDYHPDKWVRLRHKFNDFWVDGVAVYFSVTITTMPLVIKTFGAMPVFGLFANLILLPVMVVCFLASIIAVVTWVAFPVLYVVNLGLRFVRITADWISNLPFAQIFVTSNGCWFLLYLAGVILLTRFVFMGKRLKYSAAALFIAVYVVSLLI